MPILFLYRLHEGIYPYLLCKYHSQGSEDNTGLGMAVKDKEENIQIPLCF